MKIQSVPKLSSSFGKTRCTYQAESFEPHFFWALRQLVMKVARWNTAQNTS
ncbi:MAG: hypothetical protein LBP35_01235 [Candidatus Ancillula trichonymphae]|nr:hypothetical protein [Candidatus Ancillula trichonymphae]